MHDKVNKSTDMFAYSRSYFLNDIEVHSCIYKESNSPFIVSGKNGRFLVLGLGKSESLGLGIEI